MSIQYTADQMQRKFPGAPGTPGFPRLADVLRREGRLEEAIQICEEGLRIRPNTLSAYLVLGKALMDAGRMEDARDRFEAALRLDPRCLSAMHFLARIMTKLQWADAAAGYYRSILELEPWDTEIRALLQEAAPGANAYSGSPVLPAATAYLPSDPPGETFEKPDGFAGDVLEVNLNDMAADFLPGANESSDPALVEESLEDALAGIKDAMLEPAPPEHAAEPAVESFAEAAPEELRKAPAPLPDGLAEPRPMDLLKEEPLKEESLLPLEALAEDGPPISGQDVEDRLDSLFGNEDAPSASVPSSTATWSPAPAETAEPEIDYSPSEASATATGDLRATETGEMPIRSLTPPPGSGAAETLEVDDYSAVDFVAPPHPEASPAAAEPASRVQGEDIERRLDELFNLAEPGPDGPEPTLAASSLPVAPGPKVGEAVSLGETVSFGGEVALREDAAPGAEISVEETPIEEASPVSSTILFAASPETGAIASASEDELVTGQDVADKLDNLFGIEEPPAAPAPIANPAATAFEPNSAATAFQPLGGHADAVTELDSSPFLDPAATMQMSAARETTMEAAPRADEPVREALPELKPWRKDDEVPPVPPATGDIMSTESLLPPGWNGDGPGITGSDVEDQLDKLFNLDESGEAKKPASASPFRDRVNTGDTASFQAPGVRDSEPPLAGSAGAPGDESDRTLIMPAMKQADAEERLPKDTGRIKESVANWLARQNDEADQRSAEAKARPALDPEAGETMILPNEAVNGDDADAFGTLAPEDMAGLSETASIEMVDGEDVAERLDALFADEGAAIAKAVPAPEMPLFLPEADAGSEMPSLDEGMVSGADVSSRIDDIFETGAAGKTTAHSLGEPSGTDVPGVLETEDELPPAIGAAKATAQPVPELAPMLDEEEGYPEEEDSASGAGANVATVTLAEIYFQQGLREQALQIYRQLFEREPDNETVRKRIEEIEAAKPEGGDRGPGSDPRRPRPGLKVPKRKK